MQILQQIVWVAKKEMWSDWKHKNSIYGIILYLVSLVFLVYLLQEQPDGIVWNTLIWISILFITINAIAKSFLQESKGRWMYIYTMFHPVAIILGKLFYNAILMLLVATINLLFFVLLLQFPVIHTPQFLGIYFLGAVSFSILFTFLSAIVSKVNSNSALLPILGFPLAFPLLIVLSDLSISAFQPMLVLNWNKLFIVLIALDVLIVTVSIYLFPFVWKD